MHIEIGEYIYKQSPTGKIRITYKTVQVHNSSVTIELQSGVEPAGAQVIAPEDDFAVSTLKTEVPLPADFAFPKVLRQNMITSADVNSFVVSVNFLANMQTNDIKREALLNQIDYFGYSARSTSQSRVEEGDSGAPLFAKIQGFTYLVGVVKGKATSFASNYDVFSVWADWL